MAIFQSKSERMQNVKYRYFIGANILEVIRTNLFRCLLLVRTSHSFSSFPQIYTWFILLYFDQPRFN